MTPQVSLRSAVLAHRNDYGFDAAAPPRLVQAPSVTCVIPYHETGLLASQVAAVLLASLRNYRNVGTSAPDCRLIVVDDGSRLHPFEAPKLSRDIGLQVVRLGGNQGRARARNVGLRIASASGAEVTVFVDSDVLVPSDHIANLLRATQPVGQAIAAGFFMTVRSAEQDTVEQVSWGVQQIRARCTPQDYVLLVNADSRIDADGMRELLAGVAEGTECIQQSAVFLANFARLGPLPAAEALLQSTWTIETELFRYLAGSGAVRWLPRHLASMWYQHTVGHGLLISVGLLDRIGGFPSPTVGLEDSTLGYMIRAQHRSVQPLRRLEFADAPSSLRSLLRQRSTWVHGPLGALSYRPKSSRERLLVAQALYDGGKWALTLPAICAEILLLDRRGRLLWALMFFARRYMTLTLMLRSLPRFSGYGLEEPPARKLATAVALYPVAILSYGAGGLWGALEMLSEWVTGNPRIQPRTDG